MTLPPAGNRSFNESALQARGEICGKGSLVFIQLAADNRDKNHTLRCTSPHSCELYVLFAPGQGSSDFIFPAARLWTAAFLQPNIAVRPCVQRVMRHSSSHSNVRTHSASFLSNSLQTEEEFM